MELDHAPSWPATAGARARGRAAVRRRSARLRAQQIPRLLHGTKDRPAKEFEREEQRLKYEALEAARDAERATAAERAAADGAGPSSDGDVDIEQPAVKNPFLAFSLEA